MDRSITTTHTYYLVTIKSEDIYVACIRDQKKYLYHLLRKRLWFLFILTLFTLFYYLNYGNDIKTDIIKALAAFSFFSAFYIFGFILIFRILFKFFRIKKEPIKAFYSSDLFIWESETAFYIARLDSVPAPSKINIKDLVSRYSVFGITDDLVKSSAFYNTLMEKVRHYNHFLLGDARLALIYRNAMHEIISNECALGHADFFR